jgi:HNH endonuclease
MKPRCRKRPGLKLDAESYRELRRTILDRDGRRCRHCGTQRHLQVHHIQSRGQLGNDEEDNLITVCVDCHGKLHRHVPCATIDSTATVSGTNNSPNPARHSQIFNSVDLYDQSAVISLLS